MSLDEEVLVIGRSEETGSLRGGREVWQSAKPPPCECRKELDEERYQM